VLAHDDRDVLSARYGEAAMRWLIASVVLILVGCGGAGTPALPRTSAAAVPDVAASPTPTPYHEPAGQSAAATAYSAAEQAYLTTFRSLGRTKPPGITIDAKKSYYAAAAKIEGAYVTALLDVKRIVGPDRSTVSGRLVADDIQSLIDIHDAIQGLYMTWADPRHASDILAEDHAISTALDAEGLASMQVRSDLGLQR
jgi:hypothetical protein